mgnify:CR=1 FL=1
MRRPRTIRAWAVLVWLALWQLGAMAIDQQIILVSPLRVLSRLWELIPTPDFWGSTAYSLVRITAGFLLGVAAGTVLAVAAFLASRVIFRRDIDKALQAEKAAKTAVSAGRREETTQSAAPSSALHN